MALRITNSFLSFAFSLFFIFENVSAQSIYCKNETLTARFKTSCIACSQNYYTRCPAAMKLTSGRGLSDCTYYQEVTFPRPEFARLSGCRHVCEKAIEIQHCCPGRWGKYCDECPGGADTPCNNHGVCNETIYGDGICTCYGNFSGYACERCENETLYGPNCTEVCQCVHGTCNWGINGDGSCRCFSGYKGPYCDEVIPDCVNLTCSGRCAEVDGNVTCVCDIGYVDTGNGSCTAADPCRSSPCDSNASCIANGTLEYNCTCNYGYQGDGWSCDPVDNCQKDNGGCPANTTVCIYNGPKQIECNCKPGYAQYVNGFGCELQEMCTNVTCPKHSSCKTTGPQQYECICDDSYSGRYGQCNGNILQTLHDLNKEDPELMGQLDLIIKMIETYYKPEMMNAVPITVFAPNNNGFRTLPTSNFQKWLNDSVQASQFLRQHTVVGEFTLQDLYNSTVFYTLQGSTAELMARSTKQGEVLRFRLLGDNNKAKIVKGDILASNGVIHVINTLLTNPPEVTGDPESSVLEIIINNGRYRRFTTFISAAGLEDLFLKDNITVFAPINNAFDSLPVGAQEHLQKPEAQMQLIGFMKNHVVEGVIEAARLIDIQFVKAISSVVFSVNVTSIGQIILNGNINISQTDIPAKNGLIYDITSVMLPDSGGSLLPGKCDTTSVEMVKGTCVSCQEKLTCRHKDDISLGLTSECSYWVNIQGFKYLPFEGCSLWCNRTYHIPRCCPGFYGLDCLPCPGGHNNPCNGNGVCAEGKTEKGTCKCKTNFAGESCDRCSRPNYFGANCSQACTCLHGTCNEGPTGDGKCQPGCYGLYTGENCDKKSIPCGKQLEFCHANSVCVQNEFTNNFTCICTVGYRGDGITCEEIDPCAAADRGGCHIQATCTKTGPGQQKCTCIDGWTGDGKYCYPAISCKLHADCDINADCYQQIGSTEHVCKCKDGYHGNGTFCVLTNMCTTNNGGCHPKAVCTPDGPGALNCTCPSVDGYAGDGYECYGTIVTQIMDHPNLTLVASLLKKIPAGIRFLNSGNYTVFVPHDEASMTFIFKAGAQYWQTIANLQTLMSFHTIEGIFTTKNLAKLTESYRKFDTLVDGFSLHIFKEEQGISLAARYSDTDRATVIEADILAINGYLNIIDKVLEPFYPPSPDEYPELKEFFKGSSEYSIFGSWLQKKGILNELEDLEGYTLFAPNNKAMQTLNRTVTTEFLRFYVLPKMIMMASMDDGQIEQTILGSDHLLKFNIIDENQVLVNSVPVSQPDIFTYGGLVNGLDGIIHPILHWCDVEVINTTYGSCGPCGTDYFCPQGFEKLHGGEVLEGCIYWVQKFHFLSTSTGCKGVCIGNTTTKGCCAGYFGPKCDECPGGPELPCSEHGVCSDGLNGTGQCTCDPKFTSEACNKCVDGWTGDSCEIDINTCEYQNGGCSLNANCTVAMDNITCQCKEGFEGDGYSCYKTIHTADSAADKSKSAQIPTGAIVGPLVALLVIAIIVCAILLYRKYRSSGFWELWRIFRVEKDSDNESIASLHGDENEPSTSSAPAGNINFDNPLFKAHDDL